MQCHGSRVSRPSSHRRLSASLLCSSAWLIRGKLFGQRCCNLFGQGKSASVASRHCSTSARLPRNHPACRNAAWIWQKQQCCAQIAGDKTAILQCLPLHRALTVMVWSADMCGQLRGLNRQTCVKSAHSVSSVIGIPICASFCIRIARSPDCCSACPSNILPSSSRHSSIQTPKSSYIPSFFPLACSYPLPRYTGYAHFPPQNNKARRKCRRALLLNLDKFISISSCSRSPAAAVFRTADSRLHLPAWAGRTRRSGTRNLQRSRRDPVRRQCRCSSSRGAAGKYRMPA